MTFQYLGGKGREPNRSPFINCVYIICQCTIFEVTVDFTTNTLRLTPPSPNSPLKARCIILDNIDRTRKVRYCAFLCFAVLLSALPQYVGRGVVVVVPLRMAAMLVSIPVVFQENKARLRLQFSAITFAATYYDKSSFLSSDLGKGSKSSIAHRS